jgi:D-3-phosphoglycerate dehydrogenase
MAYTLVDADSPVPQSVLDEIAAIHGVLMARYLPLPGYIQMNYR